MAALERPKYPAFDEGKINAPVSTAELERRWSLVRAGMAERGIDVLLMQANNDFMGGYVKYLTDIPVTNGYPSTVVFPRDGLMTVIGHGGFDAVQEANPDGFVDARGGRYRGVNRYIGSPSFVSCTFTSTYDAERTLDTLRPFARATVGLVGAMGIPIAFLDHVRTRVLAHAQIVDASEVVDAVRAVKSEEEIDLARRTAASLARAADNALRKARPGMREFEITAGLAREVFEHGAEQGHFLCASAPRDVAMPRLGKRNAQARKVETGDVLRLALAANGPGGHYVQLARTGVVGEVSGQVAGELKEAADDMELLCAVMRPGVEIRDVLQKFSEHLSRRNKPVPRSLVAHGVGYDMVERPLLRADEPMELREGMLLCLRPNDSRADTFLLTRDGMQQLTQERRAGVDFS